MKVKSLFVIGIFMSGVSIVSAQENELEVSTLIKTEGIWNTDNGETNLINLIETFVQAPLWNGSHLTGIILANQNTRIGQGKSWNVANDLQSFSNIQTDNQIPLSLMEFDVTQRISDNLHLSLGVRNINVDYFTYPLTSVFTGSSHGIFPTIADNWSVANYPLSALGLHIEWNITDNITLKNSLYNGQASDDLDRVFRFSPKQDGILNAFELGYIEPKESNRMLGEYHLGAVYGNTPEIFEDENQNEVSGDKVSNISFFGLLEQPVIKGNKSMGLFFQTGLAPRNKSVTYGYFGAGLVFDNIINNNDKFGIQVNRALYSDGNRETDMEITYSLPVIEKITVQPSLHVIRTSGETINRVGLIRAIFEF